MVDKAIAPGGNQGERGKTENVSHVTSDDSTISREPLTKKMVSTYDPVAAYRRLARTYSDTELLAWRAQECANYHLAADEPYPENSRIEYSWRLEAIETELTARERRRNAPAESTAGFSDCFVQGLKECTDLAELVQDWGDPLRKVGKEHVGDCPFHESKSRTSLNVNMAKGLWLCRGCGRGGDAITWLTERWGLSFTEAVTTLATMAGKNIPEQSTARRTPKRRAVRNA